MSDPYLYPDVPVLRNKLEIRDAKTLDLIEAEQSRASMMLLYERGFHTSGKIEVFYPQEFDRRGVSEFLERPASFRL